MVLSYRVTLKEVEKKKDDKEGLLAKCHKRCAERWVLLELNGELAYLG